MVRAKQAAVALAGVTLAVTGLTACKSSGGSSDNGATVKANATIRLMVNEPLTGGAATGNVAFPGPGNGAKAAAAALNKAGGINGHKVVIDICDNKADPNGGPSCVRTAKTNGDLAIVGSFDLVGATAALPIAEKEGIPWIGGLPGTNTDLENADSFQFEGGVNVGGFGTIAQTKDQGCKSVVDFSPGGPAASLDPYLKTYYKKAGTKLTIIVATAGTADMTPFVSQALALKPDCVVTEGPGQDDAKIISALRKAGSKVKIFTSLGALVPPVLASLGSLADGIYADNTTLDSESTDAGVTAFRNGILSYMGQKAGEQNLNEFAQDGWASVMLVKDELKGVKDITSKNLLDKLNKTTDANVVGVHNPIDFTKTRDSKVYPRLFNTYVRYFVVKAGKYVPLDNEWHDAAAYIP